MKHDKENYKRVNLAIVFVIFALLIFTAGVATAQKTSGGFLDGSIKIGYDSRASCAEYCDGADWTCPASGGGGGCTAPASCPNVGDVCSDGSLFAGFNGSAN